MASPYRFGAVEVRPVERQVLVDGRAAALGARAFDVLIALIENRDRLVTKNELLDRVWAGVVVEENNVQAQVSVLRRVLGPGAIVTIPGRGYRFAAAVEPAHPAQRAQDESRAPSQDVGPGVESALLGRHEDVALVTQLMGSHRLVTITGPGGIGKTTLAHTCRRQVESGHADGVWWVDMAALSTGERIPAAIANAARVALGDGPAEVVLARALADRAMLIVLDNCEHLVSFLAPLVQAALEGAPRLRLLATSQAPLLVPGEQVYRLGALAVPPPDAPLGAAREFPAIRLLEQRAQAADSRFALDETSIGPAIDLCTHLDGIPLAIEMAAARVPALGLAAITARLGERLRLLRAPGPTVPARQRTLQATLDWSYSMLSPQEQATLRRLAVFAGSFPLEAAQRVAQAEDLDPWAALDALASLVDKSLVQMESGEPPRYRLLETTRLHALEELRRHGEEQAAHDRHGEAMAERAGQGALQYLNARVAPNAEAYVADYDDLSAAYDRAAARNDAHVAARVGRLLNVLDFERNVHANVRQRKRLALRLLPFADPRDRAQLLSTLCLFRTILLPGLPRVQLSRQRVAAWRALGDQFQSFIALARLGADLAVERDFDGAQRALAEAEATADPGWPPVIRWFHAYAATNAAFLRGDVEQAQRWSSAMLEISESARWIARIAEARIACAHAALVAGDAPRALALAQRSEAELREMDHRSNFADALAIRGAALATLSRCDDARNALLASLAIARPVETALPVLDQAARLAAIGAQPLYAARLLGFTDEAYVQAQDRRVGAADGAEREAARLIDEALGTSGHLAARNEGRSVDADSAIAMARRALEQARY